MHCRQATKNNGTFSNQCKMKHPFSSNAIDVRNVRNKYTSIYVSQSEKTNYEKRKCSAMAFENRRLVYLLELVRESQTETNNKSMLQLNFCVWGQNGYEKKLFVFLHCSRIVLSFCCISLAPVYNKIYL